MITVTLTEREVRALAATVDFNRMVFERIEVAVAPEENALAAAHLKLLHALETQEDHAGSSNGRTSSFGLENLGSNPSLAAHFEVMDCRERGV